MTVAMHMAYNRIIPPKEWYHDPLLRNDYGETVGLVLAFHGIIPSEHWMHDINLKNYHL